MKILKAFYSGYALLVFVVIFIFTFPFFLIPIFFKNRYNWTGTINRLWANIWMRLVFLPVKIGYEEHLLKDEQYILCPNHFSYLDIPTVGLCRINTIFVGKTAFEKIPLFGWMYKKLHITVNRQSMRSKYDMLVRSKDAIKEGKNLVIFPEGGIVSNNPPELARFKDGAFRIAIETGTPVVPVTIPYNWKILPASLLFGFHKLEIIFHRPIKTEGLTMDDIPVLKGKVWQIMDKTLSEYNAVKDS